MGSLSLRPGDSLTAPRAALSIGFIRFVSSTNATQATGFRLFPRWDSPPTEHASLSLVALWSKNSNALRDKPTCVCTGAASRKFEYPGRTTYLLASEDVDREGDYDDIEDKRAERLKNTGSPMNP